MPDANFKRGPRSSRQQYGLRLAGSIKTAYFMTDADNQDELVALWRGQALVTVELWGGDSLTFSPAQVVALSGPNAGSSGLFEERG